MPTFDELKNRYMKTISSTSGSLSPSITTKKIHPGCHVQPLFATGEYFKRLRDRINALTGPGAFIYIAGWWSNKDFSLDGTSGTKLVDLLKTKAKAGVDVRFLGWVLAPEIMQSKLLRTALSMPQFTAIRGMFNINQETMDFVLSLRSEPALKDKAALNVLAHPAGSVHLKFVLLGNNSQAWGFTGGLDFQQGRWDPNWHDAQVEVSGPVCQDMHDSYRLMWNENQSRTPVSLTALTITCTSRTPGMPTMSKRTITSTTSSKAHVQSLRTLPQFNIAMAAGTFIAKNTPLSYAQQGAFEIKEGWQKAISGAQQYIYMEDQAFFSQEVFTWINDAIKKSTTLKVILLTGMPDPNDTPSALMSKCFAKAVNDYLIKNLNTSQKNRIRIYKHKTKVIHAKTTIIDDKWAIIGSANCMRRSLYTDFEHSAAFMDEADILVPEYRRDLWGKHVTGLPADINAALHKWFQSGSPSSNLKIITFPITTTPLTADEQIIYDELYDADSRKTWGSKILELAKKHAAGAIFGSSSP